MAEIDAVSSLIGVVLGFLLFVLYQWIDEMKKRKDIARSFLPELELNLGLIRLAQEEMKEFREKDIVKCTKPFQIYNHAFPQLTILGSDFFTKIKTFYDLVNIKERG